VRRPRFKIDSIEAFGYYSHDGYVSPTKTVALFRRRWWGWQQLQAFSSISDAEEAMERAAKLPIYRV